MTEIQLPDHVPDYKEHLEQNTDLSQNTVRQRKYAVQELAEHNLALDTDDFYGAVDTLDQYFNQVSVHNAKVSAVRDFIEYLKGRVDTETEDQLDSIKERITMDRLSKGDSNDGSGTAELDREEIESKLLNEQEIEAARQAADKEQELIIDVMLDTGMRPGEVAALRPQAFLFDRSPPAVEVEDTYLQGQGLQGYPKHKSFRTLEIPRSLANRLESFSEETELGEGDLLFNGYRRVYDAVKDVFTTAQVRVDGEEAGSTEVTPHWLRHNACTRLIQKNRKEDVQEYMGHQSITTTEVYQHFDTSKAVGVNR